MRESKVKCHLEISSKQLAVALAKLGSKAAYEFVIDMLEYFNEHGEGFDNAYLVVVDHDEHDGSDYLWFVAKDNPLFYHCWVEDATLCQEGECEECGIRVTSWAKNSVCPMCGGDVYLT